MNRFHSTNSVLLDVQQLKVAYGKAEVVHGIDIKVHQGEFVVLLGRNGAGKSSLLHALAGLIDKKEGKVFFDGVDITSKSVREVTKAGLVTVLEGHRVFTSLTVEDNLSIGVYGSDKSKYKNNIELIYEVFPELAEKKGQLASRLSGGQQQILAVAQGIVAEPKLLILDEPSGGLAPIVVHRILTAAKELTSTGMSVLLVEQLVKEALGVADYCYLIETGTVGAEGTPAYVERSDVIKHIYLGGG